MSLKRLWDTTEKKMVFAKGPTGHDCQVWTDEEGSKLYIYDMAQWLEYTPSVSNDGRVYGPQWKPVDGDDEVGFYETNVPKDLYTWESGDEVSYRFMNGTTVLQSGKVDEGETPEYTGETPTKEATAQYTYTFSGWKPTLGPIYKKTDFKAQFDSTVNQYTATIVSEDTSKGTVDDDSVTADYGAAISANGNVLTIGTNTITATAETGYEFSSWGELPATVTEDLTITATFVATIIPITSVTVPEDASLTVTEGTFTNGGYYFSPVDANDASNVSVTFADDTKAENTSKSINDDTLLIEVHGLAEGETTMSIYVGETLQGTVAITVSAPL